MIWETAKSKVMMINAEQLPIINIRPSKIFFVRQAGVYVVYTSDAPQKTLCTKVHDLIDDLIELGDMVLVTAKGTPFFTPRNDVGDFERGYDYVERNFMDTPAEQISRWTGEGVAL